MRRATFVVALIIGLMGVMVLPVQADDDSDDSRDDSRNESGVNQDDDDDDDDDDNFAQQFGRRVRLSGKNEVPAGDPDGSGWAKVRLRSGTGTVCYTIKVRKLDAVTGAHIHVGVAGVNGGIVVDLAILTADKKVRDNATIYSDCVTGVAASLIAAIKANPVGYYLNVHTTVFPGGAIRGQLRKVGSS